MSPNRVTTKTGIVIGVRYTMPPPRDMGLEAEAIQKALLSRSNVIAFHGAMKPRKTLPNVIRTCTPVWLRVWQATAQHREFVSVWWAYRKYHSWSYAARIAYGITFRNLPF